ncbi:TIGR01777 family oxidoreductase [Myxococcaceae bacterium GXIMD 01537]
MKVAVTGATGFIGGRLVQRLLERGHAVHVLARDVRRALDKLPPGVTGAAFELRARPAPEALAGADALIHLAGESVAQRWTEPARQRIRDSRVEGTRAVVEAVREAGTVRHLVSASAIGYYGGAREAQPLTEDSPSGTDFLSDVCRAWEAEAWRAREAGIRTVVPRIGVVLHPDGGALHKMLPAFRMGAGGRVGSGRQYVSWIHREDLVEILVRLVEEPRLEGPINATSPGAVTNAEFAHALGEVLHRPAVMHMPGFVLKAALGEMARVALEGQRVVPRRLLDAGFSFRYPELRTALEDLLGEHLPSPTAPGP